MTGAAMDFAGRLRSAREALRVTQSDLAARCGVSLRALQDYEGGKRPASADTLRALSEMGIDADWLLTGDGQMLRGGATPAAAEPAAPLNADLLRDCIEVLREEMQRLRRTLTPAQEAEAITLLYEMMQPEPGQDARPVDRGVVVRLLRFAG